MKMQPKIGDVLVEYYDSWRPTFYQVIKVTDRQVTIREIGYRWDENQANEFSNKVTCHPMRDKFIGKPITKKYQTFEERHGLWTGYYVALMKGNRKQASTLECHNQWKNGKWQTTSHPV